MATNPAMVRGFRLLRGLRDEKQYSTPTHDDLLQQISGGDLPALQAGAAPHHRLTTDGSGAAHRPPRQSFEFETACGVVTAIRNVGLTPAYRNGHDVRALDISSVMQSIAAGVFHNKSAIGCFIFQECLPSKPGSPAFERQLELFEAIAQSTGYTCVWLNSAGDTVRVHVPAAAACRFLERQVLSPSTLP